MSKRRKIIIALGVLIVGVIIGVLIIGALGYVLYSRKAGDAELVFPATEVGTPVGDKVTMDIGPAGGTLASPDGRLTLIVPPNALTGTVSFTIQPITNKAEGGLGLAYRLGPDGKTFTTPLQLAVRYDDHDLEGTVAEALSIAYQDKEGAWHAQKSAKLDQATKTLTIATTHFTDFAALAGLRMSPVEATVYPGEVALIHLVQCKEQGFIDKILSRPLDCSGSPPGSASWVLKGPGKIVDTMAGHPAMGVTYTAPAKKPTPNVAWVNLTITFAIWDPKTGETSQVTKPFSTKITILDQGYEASGQDGPIVYSGVICDSLEKPFSVTGTHPLMTYHFDFKPTSGTNGTKGTASFTATYGSTGKGSGEYRVQDALEGEKMIIWSAGTTVSNGMRSGGGSGDAHIFLTPHDCAKKP